MKEWFYDEMRQIGTDYESEEEVQKYDERMSRFRNIEAEIAEIMEATGLKDEDTLVEFGCGTGTFALASARICSRVTAVDISPVMLSYAQKKATAAGLSNISFVNAGFLNYEHGGDPADVVVSQLALHHLPDFWKMVTLKKISSMLKTGGRLFLRDIVFSLNMEKYEKSIDYAVGHMRESAGEDTGKNFINHIKSEYSTFDWIMEEMLYRAGLDITMADYRDDFVTVYSCVKVQPGKEK